MVAGTYNLNATNGTCSAAGADKTVNAQPQTPVAPAICVVQPSLCGPTTGSVTILSPTGAGYEYSINNGSTWQAGTVFNNLAPGSVTGVKARKDGCESTVSNCDASNCSVNGVANIEPIAEENVFAKNSNDIIFEAYPVPFKELLTIKYRFDYKTDVKIEIFNSQGILVLSKKDQNSYLDKEIVADLTSM